MTGLVLISQVVLARDSVTLQLKWHHQFQFAGYYAARKEGYFADEGLNVEFREVVTGETAAKTVLEGRADYGIADSSLVLSRLRGADVVVLAAIFQQSPLVLATLADSGITHPLDLRGKRIMFRRNIDDAVLFAMFVEVGLDEDDYIHVPHSFEPQSLLGDTDAISVYTTNQPYFFQQRDIPINIIAPANYGIDFYGDMLFTSQEYLVDNPEQVKAFRRASIRGWDYAVNHPEATVDWMLDNLPTDKTREELLFEAQRTIRLIKPDLVEIGYFSEKRLWRIANIYRQMDMAPTSTTLDGLDYRDHLDRPWLHPALRRGLLATTLFVVAAGVFLSWNNRRLKRTVDERTREIEIAKNELERRQNLLDHHVPSITTDREGRIASVSEAFCRVTGYSSGDLIGKSPEYLFHPTQAQSIYQEARSVILRNQRWSGELCITGRFGEPLWLKVHADYTLNLPDQPIVGGLMIAEDITDHKKILALSTTDVLTGLPNRRKLETSFELFVKQSLRYNRPLSIILFDIDHFKAVNDTLGHDQGDEVLKTIAGLLNAGIRQSDLGGRWGGEEFMVLCPETGLGGAAHLAENLRRRVEGTTIVAERTVTSSFGVAQWRADESIRDVAKRADQALYEAKGQGRNQVVTADTP